MFKLKFLKPLMRKNLTLAVMPLHYDLLVNTGTDDFDGTVQMHLVAENPVKSFKFNSKELKLSDLVIKKGNNIIESKFEHDGEFVNVLLEKEVSDEFLLSVSYSGKYDESMIGFYKSTYNDNALYSTHFEATDARRGFPCFDQPDMKATFSISIRAPEGMIALSNGSLKERNGNLFTFNKTPLMSTYIVAYIIGKLDYIEDTSVIPIRVYADPVEKHWGQFALDVSVRCLKFFEEYFEIKYPLPKLDMVAIPQFAMGAMENWGLITYRKTSLLFDETSTSMRSKKNIAGTICHELAHMWFGNLVTMKWWNDLWLNEGFATWAATLAIANSIQDILPSDAWTNFVTDEMNKGMEMDSTKSTHKIAIEIQDPDEIGQTFSAIAYSKGSSVIRMLENWLGNEVFRKGLVHYLNKFKYSNSETHNLWDSLSLVANEMKPDSNTNVAEVIDPWIQREGFPYITVVDLGDKLQLTQKRFTVGYEKSDDAWPIPIHILWNISGSEEKSTYLLNSESIEIEKVSSEYKLNDDVAGFYRVLYSTDYYRSLLKQSLSSANRLNLYSDVFAFTKAGILELQYSLDLIEELQDESNYDVLDSILSHLFYFKGIFYDSESKVNYFNKKIGDIVQRIFDSVDLKGKAKDLNSTLLHSVIVSSAVSISFKRVMDAFNSLRVEDINPEYMRSYFISQIDSKFDETFKLYKTSSKPGEKQHALVALGKSKIEKNVDFIFDNIFEFESQDMLYLVSSLGSNLKFRIKIVNLFIDRFEEMKKAIKSPAIIRTCIKYVFDGFVDPNENRKVIDFLNSLSTDPEMDSSIKKCFDSINLAKDLRKSYLLTSLK